MGPSFDFGAQMAESEARGLLHEVRHVSLRLVRLLRRVRLYSRFYQWAQREGLRRSTSHDELGSEGGVDRRYAADEMESGFSPEAKAVRPQGSPPSLGAASMEAGTTGATRDAPAGSRGGFSVCDLQMPRQALEEMLLKRGIELDPERQPYACGLLDRARAAGAARMRAQAARAGLGDAGTGPVCEETGGPWSAGPGKQVSFSAESLSAGGTPPDSSGVVESPAKAPAVGLMRVGDLSSPLGLSRGQSVLPTDDLDEAEEDSWVVDVRDLFLAGVQRNPILFAAVDGLAIPDFQLLQRDLDEIMGTVLRSAEAKQGEVYSKDDIEELSQADPDAWAVSVCTVDGQTYHMGQADVDVPLMQAIKPFLYALALKDRGQHEVNRWIGTEPTALDPEGFTFMKLGGGGHGGGGGASSSGGSDEEEIAGESSSGPIPSPSPVGAGPVVPVSSSGLLETSGKPSMLDVEDEDMMPCQDPSQGPQVRPYNPFTDTGALAVSALIAISRPFKDSGSRFSHIMGFMRQLAGQRHVGFSNSVFLALKEKRLMVRALSHYMQGMDLYPPGCEPNDIASLLCQMFSVEVNMETLAVMAATLARVGVCPVTREKVLPTHVVRRMFSIMYTSGLNEHSGNWSFNVGIPASSGASGVMLVIIPNRMGIAIHSPRLARGGIPSIATPFCQALNQRYRGNIFDSLVHQDQAPSKAAEEGTHRVEAPMSTKQGLLFFELCVAAHMNDDKRVRELLEDGADVTLADYDSRTALHIAASDGHLTVLNTLIEAGGDVLAKDRWGRTPLEDAGLTGHAHCLSAMQEALRRQGYREVPGAGGGHGHGQVGPGQGQGPASTASEHGSTDGRSGGRGAPTLLSEAFGGSRNGSESDIARLGLALGGDGGDATPKPSAGGGAGAGDAAGWGTVPSADSGHPSNSHLHGLGLDVPRRPSGAMLASLMGVSAGHRRGPSGAGAHRGPMARSALHSSSSPLLAAQGVHQGASHAGVPQVMGRQGSTGSDFQLPPTARDADAGTHDADVSSTGRSQQEEGLGERASLVLSPSSRGRSSAEGDGPLSAAAMGTVGAMEGAEVRSLTGDTVAFVSPGGDVVHVPEVSLGVGAHQHRHGHLQHAQH